MKYLKKFETVKKPEVGDYVIVLPFGFSLDVGLREYVKKSVGQIIDEEKKEGYKMFKIKFDDFEYWFSDYEIMQFNKDREYLDAFFTSKKYNL